MLTAIEATDVFAALAHDTRLRTLMLLAEHGELCVCELTHAIGVSQPHLSRHLAQLRETGLVADRRAGVWIYYRINTQLPSWTQRVLRETHAGLCDTRPFAEDSAALSAMPNRPDAPRCA
ncbi:metalloregulator ArsR/SmtB family transcription factor [Thiohalocapsa sp.]|jgi:ArsR family transcriptional regulator|uniref:metalloregulator ArsR/SmtB family transcription factor n=1 Tax=Thiohalocapsa sp. TaxID=2497641 RepID=UPI0025F25E3D|nr:metalloregulator ArsR/SmtB family transcription factor [Thiohalocapsa sp.]